MICESYRDGVMALLDGELTEPQRESIEHHLHNCPHCQDEFHRYQELFALTHQMHFRPPATFSFHSYWAGVCRKMESRASWSSWMAASLALVCVGNLMLFGFRDNYLGLALAGLSLTAGVCLLWMSYFCNCGQRKD